MWGRDSLLLQPKLFSSYYTYRASTLCQELCHEVFFMHYFISFSQQPCEVGIITD